MITFWMPCARAFCSDSLLSCSSSATRAGLDVRKRLIEWSRGSQRPAAFLTVPVTPNTSATSFNFVESHSQATHPQVTLGKDGVHSLLQVLHRVPGALCCGIQLMPSTVLHLQRQRARLQSIFSEKRALKQIYTRTSFSKGEFWPDP